MTPAIDRRGVLKLGGALAAGTTLGLLPATDAYAQCSNPTVRPEVRELSADQWNRFANAVKTLYNGGVENSHYNKTVAVYYNNPAERAGVAAFLPWLRHYLYLFELDLRRVDPSVRLPYWDWTKDSESPGQPPVVSASYFGGTRRPGDGTVVDGTFAHWKCTIPRSHTLRRRGKSVPALPSPTDVENLLNSHRGSYDQFRVALEQTFNTVLQAIGGKDGDLSSTAAPNDPLFWVIACFTDLLWWEWQKRNPNLANTYSSSVNATLPPFNVTVRSTFSTTSGSYCYRYKRWPARGDSG
ncbi:tyrosinase family protein [Streptomyces sp. NPDC060031]|uniref:tyrosinase family protein n=1 Tax=Streptomyces sp. NPDC060031 TaxID=3347043 RepID=UPI00369A30F4